MRVQIRRERPKYADEKEARKGLHDNDSQVCDT